MNHTCERQIESLCPYRPTYLRTVLVCWKRSRKLVKGAESLGTVSGAVVTEVLFLKQSTESMGLLFLRKI